MQRALGISAILVIIFAIPRGFDFSDEGLYALLADPNQQNRGGIFNYDLFFKLIYQFSGLEFGIIGLRILRLISYLIGALSLTYFWHNLHQAKTFPIRIFFFSLAGLLASYGFLPPSLSYNSISVVAACIWLALISKDQLRASDWLLLGFVLVILFYSKITVGLLLGLLTLGYFGIRKEVSLKKLLFLLSPIILMEVLFLMLFQENALTRLMGSEGFIHQRQDYNPFLLIKYTGVGFFWAFLSSALFWIAGRLKQTANRFWIAVLLLGICCLVTVFYWTKITEEWSHSLLLATLAVIFWLLGHQKDAFPSGKKGIFLGLLLVLPFMVHFGSNVYWMRLGIHYWVFWLLAAAVLIQENTPEFQKTFFRVSAGASLIVVLWGIWISPFGGSYLWESTEPWEYKPGNKILLSTAHIELLKKLEPVIATIENDRIAPLYMNPGLLYLFDRNPPFTPGYWKPSQARTFLGDGTDLDLILYNQLDSFPFAHSEWVVGAELTQPSGETLQLLWKK